MISNQTVGTIYVGNGVTTTFAIPFDFILGEGNQVVKVYTIDPVTGARTALVNPTHFTLTPTESVPSNVKPTTVSFGTAPANGTLVYVTREQLFTQSVQYQNNSAFLAKEHEKAIDRIVLMAQEIKAKQALSIDRNILDSSANLQLPPLVAEATIIVNATGDGFEMGPSFGVLLAAEANALASASAALSHKNAAEASQIAAAGSEAAAIASESAAAASEAAAALSESNAAASELAASASEIAAAASEAAAALSESNAAASEAAALAAAGSVLNSVGAVGESPNVNGAIITTNTLYLQAADSTNPGLLFPASTQTLGGDKIWTGRHRYSNWIDYGATSDVTETGANQTIATLTRRVVLRAASGSLTSIAGLEAVTGISKMNVLMNASTSNMVIRHESTAATTVNRIETPTGADMILAPRCVIVLFYDHTTARWRVVDGTGGLALNEPPKRNYIINGNFDIWQRGTSLGSGSGVRVLADRWINSSVSTYTASRQTFSLGQTDVPNEPTYFHRKVVTSSSGAADFTQLLQFIEDVRTLAGKTATLSFWAKADATKNIALELQQGFGTGGSPSTNVPTYLGQVTLTTTWQKFTVTTTVPSISGKTLGTDGPHTSFLRLTFWLEAGSDFNARTGSLGNQSGTFDFAQVQLEEGPIARPFQVKSLAEELRDCQRYYLVIGNDGNFSLGRVYNSSGGVLTLMQTIYFPVPMRINPAVTARFDINDGTPSETPTLTHIETTHVVVGADTGPGHNFDMRRVIANAEY
jgi:hypothetical protein